MRRTHPLLLLTLAAASFLVASCQGGSVVLVDLEDQPIPTEPAVQVEAPAVSETDAPAEVSLRHRFDDNNLSEMRAGLDTASELWDASGPESYVLTTSASCECTPWTLQAVVDRDAAVGLASLWPSSFDPGEITSPRTVGDLFARAEQLLSALEAEPERAGGAGCGDSLALALEFDPTNGLPTLVSDASACDGGEAWSNSIAAYEPRQSPLVDTTNFAPVTDWTINTDATMEDAAVYVELTDHSTDSVVRSNAALIDELCALTVAPTTCPDDIAERAERLAPTFVHRCEGCPTTTGWLVGEQGGGIRFAEPWDVFDWLGRPDTPAEAALLSTDALMVSEQAELWSTWVTNTVAPCGPRVEYHVVSTFSAQARPGEPQSWFQTEDVACS